MKSAGNYYFVQAQYKILQFYDIAIDLPHVEGTIHFQTWAVQYLSEQLSILRNKVRMKHFLLQINTDNTLTSQKEHCLMLQNMLHLFHQNQTNA